MRILLIDDEESITSAIAGLLEDLGCTVVCSPDGQDGLERTREGKFDLIISDIRMPRMDGLAMLQCMREDGCTTPVVLISGHGDDRIAETAEEVGAVGFLQKPVRLRQLVATLRKNDLPAAGGGGVGIQ